MKNEFFTSRKAAFTVEEGVCCRHEAAPGLQDAVPCDLDAAPGRPSDAPTRPEAAPVRPRNAPTRREAAPAALEAAPCRPNAGLARLGAGFSEPWSSTCDPGDAASTLRAEMCAAHAAHAVHERTDPRASGDGCASPAPRRARRTRRSVVSSRSKSLWAARHGTSRWHRETLVARYERRRKTHGARWHVLGYATGAAAP